MRRIEVLENPLTNFKMKRNHRTQRIATVPIMLIRTNTTIGGAALIALGAGVIGLLGLAGVQTDAPYCDWGYVIQDANSCVESTGHWIAKMGGGAFALTSASIIWTFIKTAGRSRSPF